MKDIEYITFGDVSEDVAAEVPFPAAPRTQKAAGVKALKNHGFNTPPRVLLQDPLHAHHHTIKYWLDNKQPLFARPCPKRPRHGFLESRSVESVDQIKQVVTETLRIDPEGEVMVMPRIDAKSSAILTPSQITIGPGHDGATGGKAGSMVFPLTHVAPAVPVECGVYSGTPYIETVESKSGRVYYVQLRDGPAAPPAVQRWIPRDFTARRILVPTDDMLAWETLINNAAAGDVAYIPGGSMICHAAVHCVLRGVPVFLDAAPREGVRYAANVDEKIPLRHEHIADGVFRGLKMLLQRDALYPALMVMHQAMSMALTPEGARAVGTAFAMLTRFGLACTLGELRHSAKGLEFLKESKISTGTREQVYLRALGHYEESRRLLQGAFDIYLDKSQWPLTGGSFGGSNWAHCALASFKLDNALSLLQVDPVLAFPDALACAHQIINTCHNGGPLFTKVIDGSSFDHAANGDVKFLVDSAYKMRDHLNGQDGRTMLLAPLPFTLDVAVIEEKVNAFKAQVAKNNASSEVKTHELKKPPSFSGVQVRKAESYWRWQFAKKGGKWFEWDSVEHGPHRKTKFLKKPSKSLAGSMAEYQRISQSSYKYLPQPIVNLIYEAGMQDILKGKIAP